MTILTQINFPILCVGVGVDIDHTEVFRNGVINGYEAIADVWQFNDIYKQLAYNKGLAIGTRLREHYHEHI